MTSILSDDIDHAMVFRFCSDNELLRAVVVIDNIAIGLPSALWWLAYL